MTGGKRLAMVLVWLVLVPVAAMATLVQGIITNDTTWTAAGNPYIVTNGLVVTNDATLTIDPGVDVQIQQNVELTVYGTLYAVGLTNNPITFSNCPPQPVGGGIRFSGGDYSLGATGIIRYCDFRTMQRSPAIINTRYTMLDVSYCTFSNITSYIIRAQDSRVSIVGNDIHNVQGEVNCVRCTGVVSSNTIHDIIGDNDAIDIDLTWAGPGDSLMIVEYNHMWGGGDDGIDLGSAPALIRCNIISNFVDKAVSVGEGSDATILNNLIRNSAQGLSLKDGSDPLIANNTIIECDYGIQSYDKSGDGTGGRGTVYNTIVWGCYSNSIDLDAFSTITVLYSDIEGTNVWPGDGNITNGPQFVDMAGGDFRLMPLSPCLDTGTNMAWMATLGDIEGQERVLNGTANMGAYESYGLLVVIPDGATEGDGLLVNAGSVQVAEPVGSDLTVTLVCDDPSELLITNTVTISTGQTNVLFDLDIQDDVILDGTWPATITATASGYTAGVEPLPVHDDETSTLTLTVPTNVTEGDGVLAGVGTVSCADVPDTDIVVTLLSDDTSEVIVPAAVTIPAGQTNVSFDVEVVDDVLVDWLQVAAVTAEVENWAGSTSSVSVADNDPAVLTVNVPFQRTEGNGLLVNAGTVTLSGAMETNLTVSLVSSDTSEVAVVSSLVVPAGQTSARFDISVIDDAWYDGRQMVTVTATAAGFTAGNDTIRIVDNDGITLYSPFDNEEMPATAPVLRFKVDDPDGATGLTYQVQWSLDSSFVTGVETRTSSIDTGFENLEDGGDLDPFNEGKVVGYTVQPGEELTPNAADAAYYWRIRARGDINEGGSGIFRQWTSGGSFRINTNLTQSQWFQTTDAQFNTDSLAGTRTVGSNSVELTTPGSTVTLSTESFESGWGDWVNGGGDDGDWQINSGYTPSTNTGPASAFEGTNYIYIETSAGNPMNANKTAFLNGPQIDADTYDATVSFWYHMFGADQGSLHFDLYDGSWNLDLWTTNGELGDQWFNQVIDLSSYSGTIRPRLRIISGASWASDTSLDYLTITGEVTGAGTCVSTPIDHGDLLGANGWGQLLFSDDESSGDIRYDVQHWDGDSWEDTSITNQDTSPVDISGLDPAIYSRIRIEATMSTPAATPFMNDWTITWQPQRTLWIDDVSADEGDGGATNALFTVTMSSPCTTTVVVDYVTADGSALAEGDYASTNDNLILIPGQTSGTFLVTIEGDTLDEGASESFLVLLTTDGDVVISDAEGVCTIVDDDVGAVPGVSNYEGATNVAAPSATLTGEVISTGGTPTGVYVFWGDSDGGTTNANWQYTNYFGTVGTGVLTTNVSGLVLSTTYYYRFWATNINGYSWAASSTNFSTALATVEFAATNSSGTETVSPVNMWLVLSGVSGQDVNVDYSVTGGTASNGSDFVLAAGTATVPAGNLSNSIALVVTNDVDYENSETVVVGISNAVGAALGTRTSYEHTILDDDSQPTISVADIGLTEGDAGTNEAVFTVSLSGTSYENITFDFATSNGTATVADGDYGSAAGSDVAIPAGQLSTTITVEVYGDAVWENDESFFMMLGSVSNTTVLDGMGECVVTNDDPLTVVYAATNGGHASPFATWATAATNIQDAIDVGSDGTIVMVSNGTYVLSSQILLTNGVIVQSESGAAGTIIDGNNATRCLYVNHTNAVVDGFTVTRGSETFGGGLQCDYGTVQNCIISNNYAAADGGGVYCNLGGLVQNCVITDNSAGDDGAGAELGQNGGPTGGTLRNCVVKDNATTGAAPGTSRGGGVFGWDGAVIESCTIVGNYAADEGGGVGSRTAGGNVFMRNCIVYSNTAPVDPDCYENAVNQIDADNCISSVDLNVPGANNIVADPDFVDYAAGDYRIMYESLCRDSGLNQAWMTNATDVGGVVPRLLYSVVDRGAYEYELPEIREVGCVIETDPVPHGGDAADDPSVWLHPWDPSLSLIIGTDNDPGGGLILYNLDGSEHSQHLDGSLNNVDVRYNFPLGSEWVDLVCAGREATREIVIYKVDPATRTLTNVNSRAISVAPLNSAYGVCMYRSPVTHKYYVFVNDTQGRVQQWELFDDGTNRVDATMVRNFDAGAKTEGMAADDELAVIYIGEEDFNIWKYGAEPGDGTARTSVATTSTNGPLVRDIEGLTIYYGSNSNGYLIASSQGDVLPSAPFASTFAVFERAGTNRYVGSFRGVASNGVDEVTMSDGVYAMSYPLGTNFPYGLFVCQDDANPGYNKNFKGMSWQDLAQSFTPNLLVDTNRNPRLASMPTNGFMITSLSGSGGDLIPEGIVWVMYGSNYTFVTTNELYYEVGDMLVDGGSVGAMTNYVFTNVTDNHSIYASFTESLATNGVPWWWLASFDLTNGWDAEALDDQDGDGWFAWQEYVAGTVPTNGSSAFTITDVGTGASASDHIVYWTTVTGRFYSVDSTTNLLGSPTWINVVSNVPGSSFTMSWTNLGTVTPATFYRANVRKP